MKKPKYLEACYFCGHVYGECTCRFDDDESGFDWLDFWITEPNVSVCGRFFVDPTEYYGESYLRALREGHFPSIARAT